MRSHPFDFKRFVVLTLSLTAVACSSFPKKSNEENRSAVASYQEAGDLEGLKAYFDANSFTPYTPIFDHEPVLNVSSSPYDGKRTWSELERETKKWMKSGQNQNSLPPFDELIERCSKLERLRGVDCLLGASSIGCAKDPADGEYGAQLSSAETPITYVDGSIHMGNGATEEQIRKYKDLLRQKIADENESRLALTLAPSLENSELPSC